MLSYLIEMIFVSKNPVVIMRSAFNTRSLQSSE